jgi:RNA polymerase sigma factor (TIGR02999 family)
MPNSVTKLLLEASGGAPDAFARLMPLVYEELREIARRQMEKERKHHTLSPTALVHEAYLKLVGTERLIWRDRGHFFAVAAEAMRRVLIDLARRRGRAKRGGGRLRLPLNVIDLGLELDRDTVLALDEALERLKERDPRMAEVVLLRFYAGLSNEEAARALGISVRTVKREWTFARAWLYDELQKGGA